jgi:hypothetical protein
MVNSSRSPLCIALQKYILEKRDPDHPPIHNNCLGRRQIACEQAEVELSFPTKLCAFD